MNFVTKKFRGNVCGKLGLPLMKKKKYRISISGGKKKTGLVWGEKKRSKTASGSSDMQVSWTYS